MKIRLFTRHGKTLFVADAPGICLTQNDADGLSLREVQRLLGRGECCIEPADVKRDEPTPVSPLKDRPDKVVKPAALAAQGAK